MKSLVNILLVIMLVMAVSISGNSEEAKGRIYRIQVYANGVQSSAETYAKQLESQGYSPVVVFQKDQWWKVAIGEFATYADALYQKKSLRNGPFPDAFIVSEITEISSEGLKTLSEQNLKTGPLFGDALSRTWSPIQTKLLAGTELSTVKYERPVVSTSILSTENTSLSEADLFNKSLSYSRKSETAQAKESLSTFISRFPESENRARAKLHLAYWTCVDSSDSVSLSKFQEVITEYPNKVEAGEATLRIGYLKLKNRDRDGALSEFERVAQGNVKASDDVRFESMIRCAKLYHSSGDRAKALQAFRECANVTDRSQFDPWLHVEIAGLYMELARSGAGSLDDCRKECKRIIEESALEDTKPKSVAGLMTLETYYHEKDFNKVIDLATLFESTYPQELRELGTVMFWKGLTLRHLGRKQESHKVFNKIRLTFQDDVDMFPTINFKAEAWYDLALWYKEQGDELNERNTYKHIIEEYPRTNTARNITKLLDEKSK